MSVEFDVDATSGVSSFDSYGSWATKEEEESRLSKAVFSPPYYPVHFSKAATVHHAEANTQKHSQFVLNKLQPHGVAADGGGRVDIDITIGGKDGPEYSISLSGEIHDDYGNSVELTVGRDSSGETHIHGSYDTDKD